MTSRPSHVKAGEWGAEIVFCKPCTKKTRDDSGNEVEDKFWMLRTFTVFNIDQVTGLSVERFRVGNQPVTAVQIERRYQQADAAIDATGADIRFGGNQAFYQPQSDFIQMPHRQQFGGEYYETAFHELTHWTERPKRLDWDRKQPENTYALGELIAEMGSVTKPLESISAPSTETRPDSKSVVSVEVGAINIHVGDVHHYSHRTTIVHAPPQKVIIQEPIRETLPSTRPRASANNERYERLRREYNARQAEWEKLFK